MENVKFYPGESAIKECKNVEAYQCEFMCKYPFWHNDNALIENCLMANDCDPCFEYSTLEATVNNSIVSVKNPGKGFITASRIDEIIIDENCKTPGECTITSLL